MTATTSVSIPTRTVPARTAPAGRATTALRPTRAAETARDVARELAAERTPTLAPRWHDAPVALGSVALLAASWVVAGRVAAGFGPIASFEALVAEWFLSQRGPRFDGWAATATDISRPGAVLLVGAALSLVSYAFTRRRDDVLTILLPLLIGTVVFLTAANLTDRPRPGVPSLDQAVMVTSFPSGHVTAITLLAGVVVVVYRRVRPLIVTGALVVLLGTAAVGVAVARLYLGMHHLTDVIAGGLLGLTCVGVSTWIVDRMHRRVEPISTD
jgi:membrane-associated phospholipid phosphatase